MYIEPLIQKASMISSLEAFLGPAIILAADPVLKLK